MNPTLYIVATPIGNLGDISQRAIDVLKAVDLIAAEDTRHSKTLLQSFTITTPVRAYHEHNEDETTARLIELLVAGQSIALISDAGTPLINDPGYKLVAAALENGIAVVPVPGPSAIIAALSVAGLPTHRFAFEGYLPAKTTARKKLLETLKQESRTLVFFETPHRIQDALEDIQSTFGSQRRVSIARELTKRFEQVVLAPVANIIADIADAVITSKGEFVIVVEGATDSPAEDNEVMRVHAILATKLSSRDAVLLTTRITGRSKNDVYKLALGDEKGQN